VKALLKFIVIIVILVLVAAGAAAVYIDQLAKSGIERGVTYALGVDTSVDGVRLRLRNGKFSMSGLAVSNPAGFDEGLFLRIGSASLDLPLEQLLEDVIRVPRIAIDGVDVTLLQRSGSANYDQILDNLGRFESGDAAAETGSGSTRQLIIEELVVTNIAAKASASMLGEAATVDVSVPVIRMTKLGSDSGGMTTAELTNVVTKAVLNAVIRSGGIPTAFSKDLSSQLGELGKVNIQMPAGLGAAAGNQLDGQKASDVTGDIGGIIDGLLGGMGSEKE
jgi:hypothetical protein